MGEVQAEPGPAQFDWAELDFLNEVLPTINHQEEELPARQQPVEFSDDYIRQLAELDLPDLFGENFEKLFEGNSKT